MALSDLGLDLRRLPAPLPIWHGRVGRDAWSVAASTIADTGGRLVSVWGVDRQASSTGTAACAAYAVFEGLVWVELALDEATRCFPDLSAAFHCAVRMQRAVADLSGLKAEGGRDQRPWLDHGMWASGLPPLQHDAEPKAASRGMLPADYHFVRVAGDGLHGRLLYGG